MNPLTPAQVAHLDQHYAALCAHIDDGIQTFRGEVCNAARAEHPMTMIAALAAGMVAANSTQIAVIAAVLVYQRASQPDRASAL